VPAQVQQQQQQQQQQDYKANLKQRQIAAREWIAPWLVCSPTRLRLLPGHKTLPEL